jgi:hypothetical protein
MEGYNLIKISSCLWPGRENGLFDLLQKAGSSLLVWEESQKYGRIDQVNADYALLMQLTLESGNWQFTLVPPTLRIIVLKVPSPRFLIRVSQNVDIFCVAVVQSGCSLASL